MSTLPARSKSPASIALRDWLEERGITIAQFAVELDTRRGTVAGWVQDRRRPIAKRAEQLESITGGKVKAREWGEQSRSWSGADDAELARLHAARKNDKSIASTMGRTESAIRSRRCILGIVGRKNRARTVSTAPDEILIAELRSRGYAMVKPEQHGGVVIF